MIALKFVFVPKIAYKKRNDKLTFRYKYTYILKVTCLGTRV